MLMQQMRHPEPGVPSLGQKSSKCDSNLPVAASARSSVSGKYGCEMQYFCSVSTESQYATKDTRDSVQPGS